MLSFPEQRYGVQLVEHLEIVVQPAGPNAFFIMVGPCPKRPFEHARVYGHFRIENKISGRSVEVTVLGRMSRQAHAALVKWCFFYLGLRPAPLRIFAHDNESERALCALQN